MVKLSVNVNKVATLRNARGGVVPSVVRAAETCIAAGCHGITVHPRPDGRHIRRQDVFDLAAILPSGIELNIEGYPSPEYLALVAEVRPTQATLVPDPPDVLTSNAGWDLEAPPAWLAEVIARLRGEGVRVSLFVDPDPAMVERAAELGADRVELYTEPYAAAFSSPGRDAVLERYVVSAAAAARAGLGLNAGHDLDRANLPTLVRALPNLAEVSIGHALISDALWLGLDATVRAYLAALAAD
jgi:pyridoxine 5-phosphate synthase